MPGAWRERVLRRRRAVPAEASDGSDQRCREKKLNEERHVKEDRPAGGPVREVERQTEQVLDNKT